MQLFNITYDLRAKRKGEKRNYQPLYDALEALGAERVLESTWSVSVSGHTVVSLKNRLRKHIHSNDGLLVTEVCDWATYNTDNAPDDIPYGTPSSKRIQEGAALQRIFDSGFQPRDLGLTGLAKHLQQ